MDEDDQLSRLNKPRSVWIEAAALAVLAIAFIAVGVTIILAVQTNKMIR